MKAQVSVITVSYHTGPTLWITIASALRQPECLEVVVVNNGNSAGTEKRLREWADREPRLKLISGHGNVGFGRGNNIGVEAASGGYVLLLNPDSMLPEGSLGTMLAETGRFPEDTLAGCFLVNPDGSEQRGGRRSLLTPVNAVAESLRLERFFASSGKLNLNDSPMPGHTHEVPAISGAFMFLSKAFYRRLGGFDEGYFLHMEDMDLCYRVHKAGGRVICVPGVKALHFRSTSEVTSSFLEKHKAEGFARYLDKFFSREYSSSTLYAIKGGIYARLWLKIMMGHLGRLFVSPLEGKREIARLALLYKLTRFDRQDESLAGRTALVTGGASQLGLCVIGRLLACGAKVVATYRHTAVEFAHERLIWRRCDIEKADEVASLGGYKADILFHAAPITLLPDVIDHMGAFSVRRIVAFAPVVQPSKDTGQDDPIQSLCGELLKTGAARNLQVTLLHPLMAYGAGLDCQVTPVADLIKRYGFAFIYGEGEGRCNPARTQDAADAALAAAFNPAAYGKGYFLGGGETLSYKQMVLRLFEHIGRPPRFIAVPWMPEILDFLGRIYQSGQLNGNAARHMNENIVFDNTLAIEDFGYYPGSFLSGDITV